MPKANDIYGDILASGRYKLRKPVKNGDEEIDEIFLPFRELTGADLLSAQEDFETLRYDTNKIPELDRKYLAFLVSKVARLPFETICALSAKDFTVVTMVASGFLLNLDSE